MNTAQDTIVQLNKYPPDKYNVLVPVTSMQALSNGGCDADGSVIAPEEDQSELRHELYRKEIDGYTFIEDTVCRYECTLTESELANEYISEIGLYDEDGDLVCVKYFKRKGKDDDLQMTYILDDVF